jgi:hypothetical protein
MGRELIDLTKMKIKDQGWSESDIIITMGGFGYLAKEAYKYFFPAVPSLDEQVETLKRLIEAARTARAKTLMVRISAAAFASLQLPDVVKGTKVVGKHGNSVDLELTFP